MLPSNYKTITYNLETTDSKENKNADVCQIGALSSNGKEFCRYILPADNFTAKATIVNGFELSSDGKQLLLNGQSVITTPLQQALNDFLGFLEEESEIGSTIVLVAFASQHDEIFLKRICEATEISFRLSDCEIKFADAREPLVALRRNGIEFGEWRLSRKSVHRYLFGEMPINGPGSHEAMTDVRMLMQIIKHADYPKENLFSPLLMKIRSKKNPKSKVVKRLQQKSKDIQGMTMHRSRKA